MSEDKALESISQAMLSEIRGSGDLSTTKYPGKHSSIEIERSLQAAISENWNEVNSFLEQSERKDNTREITHQEEQGLQEFIPAGSKKMPALVATITAAKPLSLPGEVKKAVELAADRIEAFGQDPEEAKRMAVLVFKAMVSKTKGDSTLQGGQSFGR